MPDPREVAAQDILKRVFRVRTTETAGTCFLAGTSQHLLTAKHVVANGNEPRNGVQVSVRGEWRAASVTILASHDVAVLCLEVPLETPPLPLDKVSAPVRQMNVGIYGFPNHSELGPWQSARVDGPLDDGSWQLGFETALPDHLQGASGGPVLNDRNEVMGIFVSHSPLVPQHAAFTPVSIFSGLLDFSITTPNALRCCVFLSDAGMSRATKLEAAVEAGSRIAATRLHRGLEPPQRFVARECFKDQDAYATAVRLLCVSDVVVVDVTEFEPASLLLLGIRSAVRAGVTIATLATPIPFASQRCAGFPPRIAVPWPPRRARSCFALMQPNTPTPGGTFKLLSGANSSSDGPTRLQQSPGLLT
jgi:Trypsin-like peptidase domain